MVGECVTVPSLPLLPPPQMCALPLTPCNGNEQDDWTWLLETSEESDPKVGRLHRRDRKQEMDQRSSKPCIPTGMHATTSYAHTMPMSHPSSPHTVHTPWKLSMQYIKCLGTHNDSHDGELCQNGEVECNSHHCAAS